MRFLQKNPRALTPEYRHDAPAENAREYLPARAVRVPGKIRPLLLNMNSRLVLTLIPFVALLLAGCDKPQSQATTPTQATPIAEPAPLPSPPPAPEVPSESDQRLEAQMQAMQDRQAELQRQLDEEKLARLEAEIAKEREMLEKEREAWRLEQELADAKAKAENAAAPGIATQEGGDVVRAGYSSPGNYDYQTFYDDLAPYGAWYDSPDYGYVWQPSVYVSDTSWRPYTCGSWAHSDAGWTWCSDEPFGWATYHYGRWGRCRQRGWVWVPGDVWAPAWVSWRRSDNHVGWCPLPPETVYHRNVSWGASIDTDCGIHPSMYIFMPVRHFDRPVLRYCEPAAVSIQICAATVNITNVFWRSGRVHCDGPKYDWIRRSVQRPVPQYTLAWDGGRPVNGHPAHRMEKDRLHVFAPKVDVPWNRTLQPRTKTARLERTEFVRAEGGLPPKMQEQFRREKASREQAEGSSKSARHVVERQQRLAEMEKSRQTIAAEVQKQPAVTADAPPAERSRPDRFPGKSGRVAATPQTQTEGDAAKLQPATPPRPETSVSDTRPIAKTPVNGARIEELPRRKETVQDRLPNQPKTTPTTPPPAHPADAVTAEKEKQRLSAEAAAREAAAQADAKTANGRARMESLRRERDEAAKQAAAERAAGQEQQKRAAETAARNEAAARELENQKAQRAQLEEQRRRSDAAKSSAEARGAAGEKAQRDEAATRERTRAAMEDRRRQQQEAADAQARVEAKRAELENQRRQAESARAAEQAARQREAMENQRRQAQAEAAREQQRRASEEAAARQREAMENQRRAAQQEAMEQQRRASQEAAARQREAMENQQRQAEENSRRQAEENAQREARDKASRAAEEASRRQSEDRGGRRGK
jgi:hypothetical protein